MNSIDLIKAAAVDSTNKLMYEHGLPPAMPAYNTAAIEAYKANQGLPPGLDAIMREKFAKAALVDEMVDALKDCKGGLIYILESYGNLYGVGFERAINKATIALNKYEALPK